MNDAPLENVFRIFDEARQLDAARRSDFLERACGTDDGLRGEILALLDCDAASAEFMAQPAIDRLARAMAQDPWSLHVGEAIGPYTIVELLGSGGAGEVWRARDERLHRDVAIKVLLPHVAGDRDRLRRFAEEARVAGALNHANLLTVYDVGDHQGIPYLVSECLEGRSLRQRLENGSVPVEEALAIARGLARGLAAAHARTIIHRDLKPENVFLGQDGNVKILDFGLAKLQSSLDGETASRHRTMSGILVGTPGYMSPEQVQGHSVDARADLFALGVMLYEMLAGHRPFRGESAFETLHAVLTLSAPALSPNAAPPALGRIAMRLLEKNPASRFQSAPDVAWALEQVDTTAPAGPSVPTGIPDRTPLWRSHGAAWGAVLAAAGLAFFAGVSFGPMSNEPRRPQLTRFTWTLPTGIGLASAPVVSPDGRRIAFVGRADSLSQLYIKALDTNEAVPIPGTEGAAHPFWSPDNAALGFFAKGRLMRVAAKGGAPTSLAEALFPFGGTWSASGGIVFAPDVVMAGLSRSTAEDGVIEQATALDSSLGDTSHSWPAFLPDGRHFLYFVRSVQDERRGVYLGRVDESAGPARTPLLRSDSNAVYVPLPGTPEGLVLYVVNGRIEARRFDSTRLTLSRDAQAAGVTAAGTTLSQPAMLSASADVLVYASSAVPYERASRLEAVDRRGRRLRLWDAAEAQNWPRVSPDGRHLARHRVDGTLNTPDLWVEDLERGSNVLVTTAVEPDLLPVWSPDGHALAYVTGNLPLRPGTRRLRIAAADGTGVIREFPCPGEYCEPTDWTPEGLLVNVLDRRRSEIWIVPIEGGAAARPLFGQAVGARDARLSRDGKWVAYVSSESGRSEVSVRSLTGSPKRISISAEGGDHPVWRRDNSELFFVDPQGQLRSVPVHWSREELPIFGRPVKMDIPLIGRGHWGTPYDVSPDGEKIYLLRRNDDPLPREIHVVIGWRELLKFPDSESTSQELIESAIRWPKDQTSAGLGRIRTAKRP